MPIIGITSSGNIKSFLNPNTPTIGTATDVGTGRAYNNGAATVTFTPAATGAAATSFTVTAYQAGSITGYTATGASSPLTVTGLQSNVAYTFKVYASNSVGPSGVSSASNEITATTVPQAPTITSGTQNTSTTGSILLSFTAGATGGKAVSVYTATANTNATATSSSSPLTFSGLTPGTSYTFTMTATNANGTSAASSTSGITRASQYTCPSGGSVSGSNCNYGATAYQTYVCPPIGPSGCSESFYYSNPIAGCDVYEPFTDVRCRFGHKYYPGSSCNPLCTLGTAYYCPNGGSLSGTTCTYAATIA